MGRVVLWIALAGVGLGFVASVVVIAESLRPEPGAKMVLMGLTCLALPMVFCAVTAVGITAAAGNGLRRWERWVAWGTGGLVLIVYGSLILLG